MNIYSTKTQSVDIYLTQIKRIALFTSIFNLYLAVIIFINFDFTNNQFQFVQQYYNTNYYDLYLGIDGLSIYFILLTCMVIPVALLSN